VARAIVVTEALVTRLKLTKIFLRYDWLWMTNPRINWRTGVVKCQESIQPLVMRTCEEEETLRYVEEFPGVFSEGEFKGLLPQRRWDHQIDLKEGHVPPRGKCYPLAA
jgi:hypothetical protein